MRIERAGTLVMAAAVLLGGCQDLNIPNQNNPDRERSVGEPAAIEALARAVFPIWTSMTHRNSRGGLLGPSVGDEATTDDTWDSRCSPILQMITEPRQPLNNDPVTCPHDWPEVQWEDMYEMISNTIEVLRAIEVDGLVIEIDGADVTDRTRAWAKLWQGIGFGQLGLLFDRAWVADEHVPQHALDNADTELSLLEYPDVIAGAVEVLEEAADMALSMDPFEIPAEWGLLDAPMTNARLAQVAHSFIARFLAISPRTVAERENVDWVEVLNHIDQGITSDLVFVTADASSERSDYLNWSQTTSGTGTQFRADYNLVGPADVSGSYQTWYNAPFAQQYKFLITTPDRRVTGATPTTNGKYFKYRSAHPFDETQGPYLGSYYQYNRYNGQYRRGFKVGYLRMDEMNLFRAEALIRTGMDVQGGVDILNVTRMGNGQLPALTVAGVSQAADCVPRDRVTGACGTLIQALEWERRMELTGMDYHYTYLDRRGFGTLAKGTLLQLPIPAEQIEVLPHSIPGGVYTFGGNLPWSAQ